MRPSRPAKPGYVGEGPLTLPPGRSWVLFLAIVLASYGTGVLGAVGMGGPSVLGAGDPSQEGRLRITATVMDVPSPPKNLTATPGDHIITLNWEPPDDWGGLLPGGYNVYKGIEGEPKEFLIALALVTTYPDILVENGVTYCYEVTAFNLELEESLPSNEACATPEAPPPPPTEPGPPENLMATAGDGVVELTWSAPADEGGAPITSYHIYRGTIPDGESLYDTVGDVRSYTDAGVINGETYYYKVTAENEVGEGPPSSEASATPEAPPTVPGPPRNPAASAGDGTVELTWSAPDSAGGRPITNYHLYRGTTPDGESPYATVGNVQTYLDDGVTNGETYYYKVSAENEVGEGALSNEASATPEAPPTPPSPPVDLRATVGDGTVSLEWSSPVDEGGSPVTNYSVYRGTTSGQLSLLATLPDVQTFQDDGVTNGVKYYYHVTAINAAGESPPSNEVSATPASSDTVPDPPVDLFAIAGDSRVSLTWQKPPSDGGSSITAYTVYRGTTPDSGEWIASVMPDTLAYTDTTVTNGVTYYYVVTAVNDVGESGPSNEVEATPSPAPTVPDAVHNLVAEEGDARVTLTWSPPPNNGGKPVTNYKIYRGTNSGDRSNVTTIGDVTTYTDLGLTNGKTYYYVVTAVNEIGEGPPSTQVSATPATVPDPPGNVRAIPGDGQVTIQWSGPYDGGSEVTSYRIYRGTTSGTLSPIVTVGPVESHVDTGRTNGVTYYHQVTAMNRVGEGARSAEVSATPTRSATVPGPPDSLIATAGDRQVDLSWTRPATDGGSPITNYTVYRGLRADNLSFFSDVRLATSLKDGTVMNGVTFYYAVTARNLQGEGPRSPIAWATPRPPPPVDRAPTVEFTFPKNGASVPEGPLTVYGEASDDTEVSRVEVSADGTTWIAASGLNSWDVTVTLAEGIRTILARATDSAQNTAMTNLTVVVEPSTTGGRGAETGGGTAPGPLVVVAAVLSFAVTAVSAWFFLNRRRTKY